jgi:squalene-hopene/tetraprenyl-beta-curcumene cyclase
LLGQQFSVTHSYTQAAPGGWGWTALPGAVPDADDTAGALLALHSLGAHEPNVHAAAVRGIEWLLDLQNGDGGLPTFCRGWGRLPFDRSCPDITAHALCAFDAWYRHLGRRGRRRLDEALHAGVQYLQRTQRADGAWVPLWFGNQHAEGQANPTYGTARVVRALNRLAPGCLPKPHALVLRGTDWLLAAQNEDGGWGGDVGVASSIEETALAVAALEGSGALGAIRRGAAWLAARTDGGTVFEAAPIGLYFARLWYAERLYPLIFTVQALGGARRVEEPEAS